MRRSRNWRSLEDVFLLEVQCFVSVWHGPKHSVTSRCIALEAFPVPAMSISQLQCLVLMYNVALLVIVAIENV